MIDDKKQNIVSPYSLEYYRAKAPHPSRLGGGLRTCTRIWKRSRPKEPLISVITAVRNGGEYLERTIESVLSQTYQNCEYIVVDGASTDGTIDIIKQYESKIDFWISEPDEGISDAFNKGLAASSGDWIIFLNADDTFADQNVLESISNYFEGEQIITGYAQFGKRYLPYYAPKNSDSLRIRACLAHQASAVHRSIFERFGGFDAKFKIRMDYDFWLRVLPFAQFLFVHKIFVNYAEGGVSKKKIKDFYLEEMRANKKNTGSYNLLHWLKFRNILFSSMAYIRDIFSRISRRSGNKEQ